MAEDKKHWYDGKFYDKLIAPNLLNMAEVIASMIDHKSSVIDVGCGTGWFCFYISDKCKNVTGLDLSSKNINTAKAKLSSRKASNINFIHGSAIRLSELTDKKFDYAVITYMIHELDEDERENVLRNVKEVADKIIIGDYIVPQPKSFIGLLNIAAEIAAGKNHYENYKSFQKEGGLKTLAEKNNFKIIREVKNSPPSSHIVLLK